MEFKNPKFNPQIRTKEEAEKSEEKPKPVSKPKPLKKKQKK